MNLVKPGITEKFHRHLNLAKVLLATEGMTIAEATFDKLWGTGIPIHEQHSADKEKWHGVGILSEILMEIHEYLQKRSKLLSHMTTSIDVDTSALPEATSDAAVSISTGSNSGDTQKLHYKTQHICIGLTAN